MSIIFNGTTLDSSADITYNGTSLEKIVFNGVEVWSKAKAMPTKGQKIKMNLGNGNKYYRVLKVIDENIVEVVTLYDSSISQAVYNGNDRPTTDFTGIFSAGIKYADSDLDTYLNTTFYNTLSDTAKAAIVPKNITQDMWETSTTPLDNYEYCLQKQDNSMQYLIGSVYGTALIGTRNVYALSIGEILEYLNSSEISYNDIKGMFAQSVTISNDFWLRSAEPNHYIGMKTILHDSNCFSSEEVYFYNKLAVRPAFQIDLSQVNWSV